MNTCFYCGDGILQVERMHCGSESWRKKSRNVKFYRMDGCKDKICRAVYLKNYQHKKAVFTSKTKAITATKKKEISPSKTKAIPGTKKKAISPSKTKAILVTKKKEISPSKTKAIPATKKKAISVTNKKVVCPSKTKKVFSINKRAGRSSVNRNKYLSLESASKSKANTMTKSNECRKPSPEIVLCKKKIQSKLECKTTQLIPAPRERNTQECVGSEKQIQTFVSSLIAQGHPALNLILSSKTSKLLSKQYADLLKYLVIATHLNLDPKTDPVVTWTASCRILCHIASDVVRKVGLTNPETIALSSSARFIKLGWSELLRANPWISTLFV